MYKWHLDGIDQTIRAAYVKAMTQTTHWKVKIHLMETNKTYATSELGYKTL